MKTLLILSAVLCVALSVRAATVVPAEAAAVEQEETPAPNPEVEAEADVAAVLPQARLSFCLDGWHSFRGNCYLLVNDYDTWRNAESYCATFESSLASAHSLWEYRFLQRLAQTGGHTVAWMGGYYFQGDWRWEDGSQFDYNNWDSVSSTNSYQCLQLSSDESKGWSNHGCNMFFPFICELRSNC
ncbi:snaclec coagulation factor IX/factor X-binding protein subunit B3-like [Centroberyx affinis]|uniref:snaclec coagulation factor IX/factor X-binding protein subunit B3-like n=1 Tax=Centroberyx affinis TaxID=166261 RepID=UPI003A5C7682